jgi:hypothetical protein
MDSRKPEAPTGVRDSASLFQDRACLPVSTRPRSSVSYVVESKPLKNFAPGALAEGLLFTPDRQCAYVRPLILWKLLDSR